MILREFGIRHCLGYFHSQNAATQKAFDDSYLLTEENLPEGESWTMAFKRIGNDTRAGQQRNSYSKGDCGMVRETRAEPE